MSAPFDSIPEGIDIAHYFWEFLRDERQGCDGFDLWRDGSDYCYLWVSATVDHDMWMSYLLEVRTKTCGTETRDHLVLHAGTRIFECEWHNKPIRFEAPFEEHVDHHEAALLWFVKRDVGSIETVNGWDGSRAEQGHIS